MTKHALLSASGSHRWLACPPSARFEEHLGESRVSEDALTGTLAHAIAEARLSYALGMTDKRKYNAAMKKLQVDPLYGPVMDEYLDTYIDYVMRIIDQAKEACPDPAIALEMRLDFSRWVPDGFGTGDVVIVAEGRVDVIDLKYGKGVPVDAHNNPQLRLYGLGAFNELDMLYDIKEVRMHIMQPRLESITTETLTAGELLQWANDVVIPRAKLAAEGKGDFASGEHCRWCRAKEICRKRAFDQLELARYEFRDPEALTDGEIAEIIGRAEELAKWAKEIKTFAQRQAVENGKHWPGWKLVAGKSDRIITDEKAAIETLELEGFKMAQICKLRGIGDLEKLVGRKKLPEVLGGLIVKPEGAPTLVPETDKRPAMDTVTQAQKEFEEAI